MRNPFEFGRELGAGELVDREEELAAVAATIRNRGKLFVIGPRRYGKTSLLAAAEEVASKRGVVVLRLDCEKYETPRLLVRGILTQASRALKGPIEKAAAMISEVASRLRPEVSLDPATGALNVGLGVDRGAGQVTLLGEALDAVEALAERTGLEVTVILDEIQQIVVEHGDSAERQLRSTVQRHRRVAYVFAGSSTRLLTSMTSDPDRPFYRLGARLFVAEIPRAAFLAFLDEAFRSTGFEPEPAALELILDRAEEVPFNVQRLAHEVWELLRSKEARSVTRASVEDALRRAVERDDPAYTQTWTTLTLNQKRGLKAVVSSGGEGLLAAGTLREFGIAASSMKAALDALEAAHLVRVEQREGRRRYRLVDPFFARWLEVVQNP